MNDLVVFFTVILPLGFLFFNLSRLIIIILHELGHAIPAIIFTKQPTKIFIGGLGDGKYWKLTIGKLTVNLKPKFSYIRSGGVCHHGVIVKKYQQIIVLLGGTVFTALIATISLVIAINYDMHGSIKLLIMIVFISALISLFTNLHPREFKHIPTDRTYYTDGHHILRTLKGGSNFQLVTLAAQYIENDNIPAAIAHLEKLDVSYVDDSIIRWAISCYIDIKDNEAAHRFIAKYLRADIANKLNADEHCNIGYIELMVNNYNDAIHYFNTSLNLDPQHQYSLNNRGYIYLKMGEYDLALADFDAAISLNDSAIYPHLNRSQVYLKKGLLLQAWNEAQRALAIDEKNVYVQIQFGRHYIATNQFELALDHLKAAIEIDETIPEIAEELAVLRSKYQFTLIPFIKSPNPSK